MEQLDAELNQDLIIPRAFYMTDEDSFESDISKLEQIYSSEEIIRNLADTRERISNKVFIWVANRYHIPDFVRIVRKANAGEHQ